MSRSEKLLCLLYGIIAISALVATWSNNITFFNQPDNGGAAGFFDAIYANPAVASFTNDLLFLAVAGCVFIAVESRRLGIRFAWVYILLSFLIAVSVMFPVFLIVRQYRLSQLRDNAG